MSENLDKIAKKVLKYPHVVGYAKTLQKRQKDGKILKEWVLQVHVSKKVSEKELRINDIIPKEIDEIPIDVVQIGSLQAPPPGKLETQTKKTETIRPLVAGISIGNATITAGTLGWFMEKTISPDKGEIFLASNAHVFSEEPKNEGSVEKRIYQPGVYDGGSETVAEYYWHKKLYAIGESECGVAKNIASFLNAIAEVFGRGTRLVPVTQETNNIDFAVARPSVPYELRFFDVELPPEKFRFVGLGFAGSDQVSIVCKQKYISMQGYTPINYEGIDVSVGNILHKTGRTSCYGQAKVLVESAFETVSYGAYTVIFDDVILTENMLSPGDSGSAVWRE
jgi:hypothetical protein